MPASSSSRRRCSRPRSASRRGTFFDLGDERKTVAGGAAGEVLGEHSAAGRRSAYMAGAARQRPSPVHSPWSMASGFCDAGVPSSPTLVTDDNEQASNHGGLRALQPYRVEQAPFDRAAGRLVRARLRHGLCGRARRRGDVLQSLAAIISCARRGSISSPPRPTRPSAPSAWIVIAYYFHQSMIDAVTGGARGHPRRGSRASTISWRISASRAASPCPSSR